MTTTRKSHVVRIHQDDDPDSEVWIDIERLDELSFESGEGYQYRKKVWKFDWEHAPDKNVTRKKIAEPDDEENFIEVPIRNSVFVIEASGEQFQGREHKFLNDATNRTRKTHSRKVYHHTIADDNLVGGQPPSDPNDYLDALGEQDTEQYVEAELLDDYLSNENEQHDAQGVPKEGTWQEKKWVLNEKDVDPLLRDPMLETDKVDPKFVPTLNPRDGPKVDPPWRLDPLQNIVNISWGGGLAVEFFDGENGGGGSGESEP